MYNGKESQAGAFSLVSILGDDLWVTKTGGAAMPDIATLSPASRPCPLPRLVPAELTRRRTAIQTSIRGARGPYPLAAANLQHWLDRSGRRRNISLATFNFLSADCGLPQFLLRKHRPVIARGHAAGFDDVPGSAMGIEGRLRLPATDRRSLRTTGREQVLDWQDSVRANMWRVDAQGTRAAAPGLERDLSIALGGYTVHSRVTVRSQPATRTGGTTRQVIEVVSWQVQICDRYDWTVGSRFGLCVSAQAIIPIPSGVALPPIPSGAGTVRSAFGQRVIFFNDRWMAEVEGSGGGRQYVIFSAIFDAPTRVRANFQAIDGTIRP